MAKRDHSLEDGIVQAAYSEFLTYGFQKASLHKIADKAGVTTGAIYTRYKNKDALFGSLLQDFLIRLFGTPFCRKVHPARGLTHFYRNTLVDFATNLVTLSISPRAFRFIRSRNPHCRQPLRWCR